MKKCLSISFAILILATASPTSQGIETILKMGEFFHHFIHHVACHQEKIDLVDFVKLHYADHDHHEADHNEHENLPFQHHHDHQNLVQQAPSLLPPLPQIVVFPNLEIAVNSVNSRSQQWLSSSYLDNIWQPPKA